MKIYLNSLWLGILVCLMTGNAAGQTIETDRSKLYVPVKGKTVVTANHISEADRSKEPLSGKPVVQSFRVTNNPSAIDLSKVTQQSVAKPEELKNK